MNALKIILAVALLAGGLVGYSMYERHEKAKTAAVPVYVPPAPDARYLDPEFETPLIIASAAQGATVRRRGGVGMGGGNPRRLAALAAAAADFEGAWIGPEGWKGPIKAITKEAKGIALRMEMSAPQTLMGGTFWVVAIVPAGEVPCQVGDVARFNGQIAGVGKVVDFGQVPTPRILVENAQILSFEDHTP